jgi:hypothetical protein
VSLPEIAARLRRHVLAILAVLVLAAGAAYGFKHTAPTYAETATMVFIPPASTLHPNPYEAVGSTLTKAAGAIAAQVMSPQGQQHVQQAGGTAQIDVGLLNGYDLEYPFYSEPYLTITTTSTSPDAVQRTFTLVTRQITQEFTAEQVQANVTPNNRIETVLAGDTGALAQPGSSKRVLGALAILTLVAIFAVASFLDRHPVRLRRRSRMRAPARGPARRRLPGVRRTDPAGSAVQDY